tara:strand:+ start:17131 stop:24600 length:7470 start_codon:yes stop_codon:yes gene_type:complete
MKLILIRSKKINMEKYIVDGKGFNVKPEDLNAFMKKYPNAKKHTLGKTTGSAGVTPTGGPKNMGSKSGGGFWDWKDITSTISKIAQSTTPSGYARVMSKEVANKTATGPNQSTFSTIANIGGEYADALLTGYHTGRVLEENLEVFKGNHSDESIEAMIKAGEKLNSLPQSDRMIKFAKAVEEGGGGFWNGLLELGKDPDGGALLASQVAMQSLAMMAAGGFDSIVDVAKGKTPDALAWMAAGAGAGALTFGAAGSVVPGLGNLIGAGGGAIAGTMGGLSTALENGLTFTELLKQEIEDKGEEYNKETVKKFLSSEDNYNRVKNKALKRGLWIGAIDMIGGGIAGAVGVKTAKSLSKGITVAGKTLKSGTTRAALAGVGVTAIGEGISGGIGEYAGQKAAGQDYNAADIILEMFAETPGALVTGPTKALVQKAPVYTITHDKKKVKYTQDEFLEKIDGLDAESLSKLDINIEGDDMLASELFDIQDNFIRRSKLDTRVSDEKDINRLIELDKQLQKAEADTKLKGIRKKPGAQERLEKIETEIDNILEKYAGVDRRTKDVRARKKTQQEVGRARTEILINKINEANAKEGKKSIKNIKDLADYVNKKTGLNINVKSGNTKAFQNHLASTKENVDYQSMVQGLQTGLQELINDPNASQDEVNAAREELGVLEGAGQVGVAPVDEVLSVVKGESKRYGRMAPIFDSDGKVVSYDLFINEETSFKDGMLNTPAHEFFHGAIFATLQGNIEAQMALGQALQRALKAKGATISKNSTINDQISRYEENEGLGEEMLAITSENWNDVEVNEGVIQGLRDTWRRFGQKYLGRKIEFNTDQDVLNFVKDYHKTVKDPKKINKAMIALIAKGAQGKLLEGIDIEGGPKVGQAFSKEASDNVQRIYEAQGEKGIFEILEQFKPIVNKIVQKRSEAPNFDRQLLTDEIETGKRGILDLVREYNPESGVPLAAYINKFLPARAIEASKRVLGEEFTDDITERVDIAAEEAPVETPKRKKKKVQLADRLRVENKVDGAVKKILPSLNLNKLNFKTLQDLTPEITGGLFGINPKKLKTGANITKGELQAAQMFISKNADLLLAMLPEGTTMSGTSTGVQNVLLKAFYEKSNRVRAAKTGSTAGLAVQVKKPNISKTEFLEVFGIIDGKPVRTDRNTSSRVLALAKQTGKMMTNQAVRKNLLAKPDSPGHVISLLEDGKSITMWSNPPPKDSNVQIENGKQEKFLEEREVGQDLPELRLTIDELTELQGFKPLDTNSKEGRNEFIQKQFSPTVATRLPESFFRFSGWTGTTQKDLVEIDGIYQYQRGATRNLPYRNVAEVNSYVNEGKEILGHMGFEFAPPDKDIENAMTRTSFGKALKLLAQGKLKEHNESKIRGLKKIWKAFEEIHAEDPELALQVIGGWMKSISAHQGHFMRIVSPIKFFNTLMGTNVEEHTSPVSFLGRYLFNRLAQGNLFDENNHFDNAVAATSFFQGQLPKIFDDRMAGDNYNYEENIPAEHLADVLSGKKSVWIRYFNEFVNNNGRNLKLGIVGGIDPNVIKLDTGKTIAQEFGIDVDVELTPMIIAKQQDLLAEYFAGEKTLAEIQSYMQNYVKPKIDANVMPYMLLSEATMVMRSKQKETKGITVLDFDDTLAITKSKIKFTRPDGTTGSLNAEEYASTYQDLTDQGYTWDFSEFNEVVGGETAPLFNKALKLAGKFGTKDMFILTARPAASAKAIQTFLKANGLDIPLKNITGLGNSTSEAKALWIADKVANGYNDFYFADDALQNVQAVSNMLDQFDVKSKVQRAKAMFSKNADETFNDILEDVTGIESRKRFSPTKGRKRGEGKGKFRFFIPPSHEDFVGLLYNFMGKGEKGNKHRKFFEETLIKPLNRAYKELNIAKQSISNDYKNLIKLIPNARKKLTKKTPDGDFTYGDAVRVYLWDKAGFEIPGMAKTDIKELTDLIKSDPELQAFADHVGLISREKEGYTKPSQEWEVGDIRTDLAEATTKVGRKKYFTEFIENADMIFSKENLNKIEAAFGKNFREALEDMLYRTRTGASRPTGTNRLVNRFTDWINGAVGSTMFLNVRSGVLQQLSMVNFINYGDNNIFKASKAFANQLQYWKDYSMIFNSDFLKQRRSGIAFDVNGAELAQAVSKSKEPFRAAMRHLLQKGFILTQIGDSNAIAMGGASFYRNRVNTYLKQGLKKSEAESKAFNDFQELAEMTQQSARPDMISQQQASPLGKFILAFQNTPSQYNRFGIKKPALDLINRRKTPPYNTQVQSDMSNMSRILYYGAIQNVIFYGLQSALFAMMFSDEDEDKEFFEQKKDRIINGSIDGILRGAGVGGAIVSVLKNTIIKIAEQQGKTWNQSTDVIMKELLQLSPPLGIKARKLSSAEKTYQYNKNVIKEMEILDIDNPIWDVTTNIIEGTTNLPVNRLHDLVDNKKEALNPENEWWQRVFLALGWDQWSLGVENKEIDSIKKEIKDRKKKERKKKKKSIFKKPKFGF